MCYREEIIQSDSHYVQYHHSQSRITMPLILTFSDDIKHNFYYR